MTKAEKEKKIKDDLNQAKQNYINEHKTRKHPKQLKFMVKKKFGVPV